ncbi:MAG TPA: glycosyltransferase family 10 [Steroidobacteraceae bacterium]|nr:glycosyltransferase family 10 [Steroidobacteraceae bacterium]
MLRVCYAEEKDRDFIRWTGNLLRGFIDSGRIAIVRQRERPDLMLASIWRPHRFPAGLPVVLVSNENWLVYPPHFRLRRYKAVIGVCPPPPYYWGDGPEGPLPFIHYPYEAVHFDQPIEALYAQRDARLQIPKTGFCCFVVSNTVGGMAQRRLEIFERVNAWQRVDSAGAQLNNTGYRAPRGVAFLDWIARYRFMICLENSHAPGYVTEKALQASLAGTVPVYDGGGLAQFDREAIVDASAADFPAELQRLEADAAEYERRRRLELYRQRPSLRDFEARFAALLLD